MSKWNKLLTGSCIGGGFAYGIASRVISNRKISDLEIERDELKLENEVLRRTNDSQQMIIDNLKSMNAWLIELSIDRLDELHNSDKEEA